MARICVGAAFVKHESGEQRTEQHIPNYAITNNSPTPNPKPRASNQIFEPILWAVLFAEGHTNCQEREVSGQGALLMC